MLRVDNLVYRYREGDSERVVLQRAAFTVSPGERVALVGASGCGKSTLLNLIGGIDTPQEGRIRIGDTDIAALAEPARTTFRRGALGFVYQRFHLLPTLTVAENVALPLELLGHPAAARRAHVAQWLEAVGLEGRGNSFPDRLSGGEQQRVAIAIGLANNPPLLLADEPTGSVDTHTTDAIMDVFRRFNRELGITIVIVTHDRQLSHAVDRVVAIRDGKTSSEFLRRQVYREVLEHDREQESGSLFPDADSTHEEFVLVDKVGRLQIPRTEMEKLGIEPNSRLRVREVDGSLVISPVQDDAEEPAN